jgi:hypothetical protein
MFELASPQGKYKAILFERSCAGTVAWVTHVSIVAKDGKLPNEQGNALVSFERHGSFFGRQVQSPEIQVRWLDPTTLELSYPEETPLQWSAPSVQSVKVVHAPVR